ncbi:NADH-quinone oxidoreductase subunit N [Archaeoglobus neptunius]|uniref:NADH-quinone oxidoreductase subunit N n=1 Tax=Archaeoglobus neptunius TaxID=2798580 RepID=UPI001E334BC9|nr:NADH-quinone oxidoreductase subunit N [Archaeoglobus neptunius]
MITELLASLIILALGSAASYKDKRISFVLSIFAVLLVAVSGNAIYSALIAFVAVLNLLSLFVIRENQIAGSDYAMIGIMAVATLYAFVVDDLAVMLTLFVVVSVPTYLLAMVSDKGVNVDVGIKYVTFMVIATVLFLIGAVLLYSANSNSLIYSIAFLMLIVGLCMEVGVAPVHEWVPDVFSSADPIPVSIIASLAKFVPFIIAYKIIIATATPSIGMLMLIVGLIAAASMFTGNIGALTTNDPSRILAYSTVANMGYILATFVAITAGKEYVYFAIAGGILQLFVNSFGKIGYFASIKNGGTSPITAYMLTFSFIGLPPLMGFWSKLFIIYSLVYSSYIWLAVILVLNSAISVPYYVRLARLLGTGWKFSLANAVVLFASVAMLLTLIPPVWFVDVVSLMKGV